MTDGIQKIEPIPLRPVASPVQTYGGPPARKMQDFIASLGQLDRELGTFIDERAKKFREEQAIRGEAAFQQNNQIGYSEAVRQGLIPAQASGSFKRAYKQSEGALAGQQLKARYSAAYEAWEGKYSDDPGAFNVFFSDFVENNVEAQDPDVLRGLLPHVRELQQNGFTQHTSDVSEHLYANSLDSHVAQANRDIEEGNAEGLVEGTGTDYPAVFEAIAERRRSFVASGGDPRDFDKSIVDAMSVKIVATRDPELLEWFDEKVPGTDITYGETPYGAEVKQRTIESLEVIGRSEMAEETAKQKALDDAERDKAWSEAIDILATNPSASLPDELATRGRKYDPKFLVNIESWRKSLGEGFSDPAAIKEVYADILAGRGIAAVTEAFGAGVFGRPEDLASAMAFARSFEGNKQRIEDALGSAAARSLLDTIDVRTKGTTPLYEPLKGTSDEGYEAQFDFKRLVMEWVANNPDATLFEREEAISKIGKAILERITPPSNPMAAGGTYTGPTQDNPFGPAPSAAPPPPAADAGPTSEATPGAATRSPAPPAQGQPEGEASEVATPEQVRAIEAKAIELGVHPEEVYRQLGLKVPPHLKYGTRSETSTKTVGQSMVDDTKDNPNAITLEEYGKRLKDAGPLDVFRSMKVNIGYTPGDEYDPEEDDGAFDERSVEFTPEEAETFLDDALVAASGTTTREATSSLEDPLAAHLVDFIMEHEAAGNYNAVFGKANSKVDLSQFTLDEILEQQREARKAGKKSTAIGGGQFIYKTLRGLKSELGLTGKEPFDADLQDRLMMALLNRRGFQQFKAGKISKRQFALRLSQEWAALPNPSTGRSYYAGDGLNSAGTSVASVYRALGFTGPAKASPASLRLDEFAKGQPGEFPAERPDAYRNIPEDEVEQFVKWNSDPIANHEENLSKIDQDLASVVRRAQEIAGVDFVAGSGLRDEQLQAQARAWGWSGTMKSDHLHGGAVDLWPIVDGAVTFDKDLQLQIVDAMQQAAKELGIDIDVGATWKRADMPHFGIKGRKA